MISEDTSSRPSPCRYVRIKNPSPTDIPASKLDSFLSQHGISAAHHPIRMLSALGQGLNHKYFVILAERDDSIVGVLPLVLMTSPFFGRHLVSLPYVNWAGVIAEDDQVAVGLIDEAIRMADEYKVRFLELRQEQPVEHPELTPPQSNKVQMRVELTDDEQDAWKMIRSSVRSQVRKGNKQGFRIEFGGEELLESFYQVFSTNMRDLGTPVFGKQLFREILTQLPDEAELCVTFLDDLPIACCLVWHTGAITEVPSASALHSHRSTAVNTWMYWQVMRRAIERRMKVFDFGRSTLDSPTFDFKRKWGAEPQQAAWQYYVRRGNPTDMRPDGGRFGLAIHAWQRLPVWFTRLIGPTIVRGIP